MTFQYSPYALLLFLAATVSIVFAWFAFRRRQQTGAITFGLLILAIAWWAFSYALHISSTDLGTQHLFNRLKYIGIMAVAPLWLILALQYTQSWPPLTQRKLALIFLPGILFLPIVLTDHLTHLWWTEVWLERFSDLVAFHSTHGAPYYIHSIISYVYAIWGLWLYVRFYRRTGSIYRSQSILMITAATIPLVANVLTQLGLSPLPWGLDCFSFTLSGLLVAIAIFRYRFLDIVPVARRAALEQLADGVILVDDLGRVMEANPAALSLMGAGPAVIGSQLTEAVCIPKLHQAFLSLAGPGKDRGGELDLFLNDGEQERVLSVSATPLSHEGEQAIGQILLLRDVSERVADERRLRALQRQTEIGRKWLASTIDTTADAIVLLDAEGQVLMSNSSARAILQAGHSDQFPPALQAVFNQPQAATEPISTEVEIGELRFHVATAPVAGMGLVLTLHDVTHFRQLSRLKDEFIATISQDLSTPLTSILGYAQIAQMSIIPDRERQDALRRIETIARRMSKLSGDLLALATIQMDGEFELEPIELGQLALTAIKDLGGTARAKGLTIQHELQAHPPLKGKGQLISQVWHNLIENAIQHSGEGTITVRVRVRGGHVVGEVADTGAGVSPTDLPYLFDKFYRVRQSSPEASWAAGLGLALVQAIVERHGGQVGVESELGVGSSFSFTLPLHALPCHPRTEE